MIVRGKSLEATMSRYLCERIAAQPNIEVLTRDGGVKLDGENGTLEKYRWRNRKPAKNTCRHPASVPAHRRRAKHALAGAIGHRAGRQRFVVHRCVCRAARLPFETNRAGMFAIGDVRSGSVKRVAASVGEGAQVVAAIHAYLADADRPRTRNT